MGFSTDAIRIVPLPNAQDVPTDVLRQGVQQLLAQALNAEVADWIERHQPKEEHHVKVRLCCDRDWR
jgi:hypothetical protein